MKTSSSTCALGRRQAPRRGRWSAHRRAIAWSTRCVPRSSRTPPPSPRPTLAPGARVDLGPPALEARLEAQHLAERVLARGACCTVRKSPSQRRFWKTVSRSRPSRRASSATLGASGLSTTTSESALEPASAIARGRSWGRHDEDVDVVEQRSGQTRTPGWLAALCRTLRRARHHRASSSPSTDATSGRVEDLPARPKPTIPTRRFSCHRRLDHGLESSSRWHAVMPRWLQRMKQG